MPRKCCVVGCDSNIKKIQDLSFYTFPIKRDLPLVQKWVQAIGRKNADGSPWQPDASSLICSAHFQGNCKVYHPDSPSYIPTIFPDRNCVSSAKAEQNVERFHRAVKRKQTATCNNKPATKRKNTKVGNPPREIKKPSSVTKLENVTMKSNVKCELGSDTEPDGSSSDFVVDDIKIENDGLLEVNVAEQDKSTEEIEFLPVDLHEEQLEEFTDGEKANLVLAAERCRLCASTQADCVHVWSVQGEEMELQAKLLKYLNIDIPVESSDFPRQVCRDCLDKLETCHQLRLLAEESTRVLQRVLDQEKLIKQEEFEMCSTGSMDHQDTFETDSGSSPPPSEQITSVNTLADSSSKCLLCVHTSSNPEDLKLHYEQVHNLTNNNKKLSKRRLTCSLCNLTFNHEGKYRIHRKIHEISKDSSSEASISCQICTSKFTSLIEVSRHYMSVHTKHCCNFCYQVFDSKDQLTSHVDEIHSKKCQFCALLIKKTSFKSHIHAKHPEKEPVYLKRKYAQESLKCKTCGAIVNNRSAMKSHCFYEHFQYCCEICLETFSCQQLEDQHLEEVHELLCSYCNLKFYTVTRFKRHLASHKKLSSTTTLPLTRTLEQKYECKTCKRGIKIKNNLIRHNYWIHNMFTCNLCLLEFKSLYLVEEHEYLVHRNACLICGLVIKNVSEHISVEHRGSKPYLCEYCGHEFLTNDELKLHRNSHEKIKTHLCDVCGRSFYFRENLLIHKKCHDKVKRQLTCDVCDRKFAYKNQLQKHVMRHTETKSYKCLDCNSSFYCAASLRSHLKKHKI